MSQPLESWSHCVLVRQLSHAQVTSEDHVKGKAVLRSRGFRFVLGCWFTNGIPYPVVPFVAFPFNLQLHPMYRPTLHGGC